MKHSALALVLSFTVSAAAFADTNLVTNGSFELTTNGSGQLGFNTNATGWSTNGYNFVFTAGSADGSGASGQYGSLWLWGPGTGSINGLPASSPDGGNYIGADGAYEIAPITQTINGLTVGATYAVSFWWAGAQQAGFNGDNTEQWEVKLGSDSQDTDVWSNTSHGFSGWQYVTFDYVASSTSEVLSFLAIGTPAGVPPFSLLDGVTMEQVPEPASLALVGVGLAALGTLRRHRRV